MCHENWDVKEFVERYLAGDGELTDMLDDLSFNQLTEIERILAERDLHQFSVN